MRPMSIASSVVRGATLARSSHSSAEWSSPPTGPRPSRVGSPSAAVVFASDAPPVAASWSSKPSVGGDRHGERHEPRGGIGLLHWWVARAVTDPDRHAFDGR